MDRGTLVDHVTEFAAGWRPDPTILAGMDTATLRELCTTVRDRAAWSGRLSGELASCWHVYRIQFTDGSAYVGMTGRTVVERLTQHLSGDGSLRVRQRCMAGVAYRFDVLASALTERMARQIERVEIAKLARPLNVALPAKDAAMLIAPPPPPAVRVYLTRPLDTPMTYHFHVRDDAANVTAALLSFGESPGDDVKLELFHAVARESACSIHLEMRPAKRSHHLPRRRSATACPWDRQSCGPGATTPRIW